MPIYEYRCAACGKRSSSLLKSHSEPDPPCPHCGSRDVRRLVSTFATMRSEEGGDDLDDFDGGEDRAEHDLGDDDWDGGDDDF
jgi:putative FmdB family regulatory protein